METIFLGIVLFLILGGLAYLGAAQQRGFNLLRQDLGKNTRSVKHAVGSKIDKAIQPKVDVSAFIENTITLLDQQEAIETHSSLETDIVRHIAEMYVQYTGNGCQVYEEPRYTPNKQRGFDLKSTYISIR